MAVWWQGSVDRYDIFLHIYHNGRRKSKTRCIWIPLLERTCNYLAIPKFVFVLINDPQGAFAEYVTTGSLGRFEGFLAALWKAAFTIVGPGMLNQAGILLRMYKHATLTII